MTEESLGTRILSRVLKMDRRTVYLIMACSVVLPFFLPVEPDIPVSSATRGAFEAVEEIYQTNENLGEGETKRPVLVAFDFDPATMAELLPMAEALLNHCFSRDIPVVGITFLPTGATLAHETMKRVGDRHDKVYGKDYAFLGYQVLPSATMIAMGEDFHQAWPIDMNETSTRELHVTKDIENFDDIGLVVDLSGTGIAETWISYAVARFDANFAMGVTAVMAADFYPYLQTQQSRGMLGGMAGAAEYETLLRESEVYTEKGDATRGMLSQSVAHFAMIFLIIVANVGFFVTRRKRSG